MNALWLTRPGLIVRSGGDTTQILKTAEALRERGCTVNITDSPLADPRKYDVVHLFHLERVWENLAHCRRLARHGVPVVLSPIYWHASSYDGRGRPWFQRQVVRRLGQRTFRNLRLVHHRMVAFLHSPGPALVGALQGAQRSFQEILRSVHVLLPNSDAERALIEHEFGQAAPSVVVPNAAEASSFRVRADEVPAERKGVLCVGRIEPRKNQLNLIRALAGGEHALTIVGRPGRSSGGYYRRCRAEGGERVRWIDHAHGRGILRLYASHRVHASVSWYETPGLASLEAALCGCALVLTPGGATREYFGDDATYCDPDDVASIRRAVDEAMRRGTSNGLRERVAGSFSWEEAAEKTLEGYRLATDLVRHSEPPTGAHAVSGA